MRQALAILWFLASVTAFADWGGASSWAGYDKASGERIVKAGGFLDGYMTAVEDTVFLPQKDRSALSLINLQIDSGQLAREVTAFYSKPENAEIALPTGMKICLEALIARTKEGPRLLNLIYAQVGGWKPFTTWEAYQAGR